jgi:hypothetical protein
MIRFLVQFTLSTYLAVLTETQTCKIYAVLLILYCVFIENFDCMASLYYILLTIDYSYIHLDILLYMEYWEIKYVCIFLKFIQLAYPLNRSLVYIRCVYTSTHTSVYLGLCISFLFFLINLNISINLLSYQYLLIDLNPDYILLSCFLKLCLNIVIPFMFRPSKQPLLQRERKPLFIYLCENFKYTRTYV